MASVLSRFEIDVEDVEYLRHGNKALMARLFKPRGTGPFPLVVDPNQVEAAAAPGQLHRLLP